jgi:hypothetical protein
MESIKIKLDTIINLLSKNTKVESNATMSRYYITDGKGYFWNYSSAGWCKNQTYSNHSAFFEYEIESAKRYFEMAKDRHSYPLTVKIVRMDIPITLTEMT